MLGARQIDGKTDIYQDGLTAFRLLNGIGTLRDKFNHLGDAAYIDLVQRGRLIDSGDYQPFVPRALHRVPSCHDRLRLVQLLSSLALARVRFGFSAPA